MNKSGTLYTIWFTFTVSFVFVVLLSTVNSFMSERIRINEQELYVRSVLSTFSIDFEGKSTTEILEIFEQNIKERYFVKHDEVYHELSFEEIAALYGEDPQNIERISNLIQDDYVNFETVYYAFVEGEERVALKFSGPGLWGTIRGILAFNSAMTETRGIEIIAMQETPGLGARIEEPWFKDQFKGERLLNATLLVQQGADPDNKNDGIIDGISGATVTSSSIETITQNSILILKDILGV